MSVYKLIDSGHFRKLEQLGDYRIVRPSPAAVWEADESVAEWKAVDAEFTRFSSGDGEWKIQRPELKQDFIVQLGGIHFQVKLTPFGHLGLFPEQLSNWQKIHKLVSDRVRSGLETNVLNLFAYTGGASVAALSAGAKVVHVDASKTSVAWAKENVKENHLESKPIRWIVDDVVKFVSREVRRGNKYQGVILDPPSYGRGPKNELWKIEEHLVELLKEIKKILAQDICFALLSSHSPGYSATALKNLLSPICANGEYQAGEMLIPSEKGGSLPSGTSCLFMP